MFKDYKKAVLDDYDQKKVLGKLSLEMIGTTPANLKDECIIVCDTRFDEKGESLLRSFFGHKEDLTAYRMAIKKHGTTKCKPLSNFLKNRSIVTEEKNIELLAWLIDYRPRPHQVWEKTHQPFPISDPLPDDKIKIIEEKKPGAVSEPPNPPKRRGILYASLLLIAFTAIGIYSFWPKPPAVDPPRRTGLVKGKCMFWAGDQYLACACNVTHRDTPVITLDTLKLAEFKKITDWSTLSKNSIRKVWYAKEKTGFEVFNDSGQHPVDTTRRLLPLTQHMLDKYILHK